MNDVHKELIRAAIDLLISLATIVSMVGALYLEGYFILWPTVTECLSGTKGPECNGFNLFGGMSIIAVLTVFLIHALFTWLQKCLRQSFPELDWSEPAST